MCSKQCQIVIVVTNRLLPSPCCNAGVTRASQIPGTCHITCYIRLLSAELEYPGQFQTQHAGEVLVGYASTAFPQFPLTPPEADAFVSGDTGGIRVPQLVLQLLLLRLLRLLRLLCIGCWWLRLLAAVCSCWPHLAKAAAFSTNDGAAQIQNNSRRHCTCRHRSVLLLQQLI